MKVALQNSIPRELNPDYMITFNFNNAWSPKYARTKMTVFLNKSHRLVFGPRWRDHTDRPQTKAYGFLENPETNMHYHLLGNFGQRLGWMLTLHGPVLWNELVPSGQLHVRTAIAGTTIFGAHYCSKQSTKTALQDELFLYTEGRTEPSRLLEDFIHGQIR